MANRSYLYAFDRIEGKNKYKDLSEWNWSIPIIHKVLASANPKFVNTHIWEYSASPISIEGDYAGGLENFKLFLELLLKQDSITKKPDLEREIQEALTFFDDSRKTSDFFLLEAGEVLDISGDLADEAKDLFNEVSSLHIDFKTYRSSGEIGGLLSYYLTDAATNWEESLGLYFTYVLYFHMGSWKDQ